MKKEKRKSLDATVTMDQAGDEELLVADKNDSPDSKKVKKKKRQNSTVQPVNGAAEDKPNTHTNKQVSNVRTIKQRLQADDKYAESLMTLVSIPHHNLPSADQSDFEEEGDDLVDDVPLDIKHKMREENSAGRVTTHEQLKDRYNKKLEELRSNHKVTNQDRHQRKLKTSMKKASKTKQKEELKQKLMKVGRSAGNQSKPNRAEVKTEENAPAENGKSSKDKISFSKFDLTSSEIVVHQTKKNLDPKAALAKIAKSKEKLDTMKEKGI